MKQQFSKIIFFILSFLFVPVLNVFAANQSFRGSGSGGVEIKTPNVSGLASCGSFEECLVGAFKWGVGAAVFLAVIMLIVGGVQYMGSESLFTKGAGVKRMQAALGGLLIALASILILTTIFGGEGGSFNVK